MGNKSCGQLQGQYLENQAYGEYQIAHEGGSNYARIVKIIESKNGYQKAIAASFKKRKQIKSKGLCELYSFQFQHRQSIIQIVLKYQYISCSLFQKRQLLFNKKQYFSLDELIKIIDTVSSALQDLYKMKIKHGCINLNAILCTENGYKITDVSTTTDLTLIQLLKRGSINQPISKKLINLFNESQKNLPVIKMLVTLEDDLFSLGIIILSLAARVQISQLYRFKKIQEKLYVQLNDELVEDYLYLLKMRYNKKLEKIVRKFLFPPKQYQQHSFSKISGCRDKTNVETHQNSYFSMNIEEQF